jgi:UDP-N-acetylglucosamine--N-acetylmuramyl-(pentapeptide) pyrophosphoryl-undecaprenol N-acetylglucosamine transferase
MRIGIAAAGSGGHVFPALAVADALVTKGVAREDIVFFGGDRMEAATVPKAGYRFVRVNIHGLRRSLSVDNLKLPAKVRSASKVIGAEIADSHLQAMVVFGGYVAGPAALAARKAHIPLIVHEANAVPGMANRLVAGRADVVLVAFDAATSKLPGAVVVGNPLRQSFESFDRVDRHDNARTRFGLGRGRDVLGIFGGSLGASALNTLAESIATDPNRDFDILHICGPAHVENIEAKAQDIAGWVVLGFEDDMADVYAACDLVVSRAGAISISEIEETATPAIVIPLPAGQGYQAQNAAELAASGGAVIMDQSDPESVIRTVFALMGDRERRSQMAQKAGETGHRQAASEVADRTLELIHD